MAPFRSCACSRLYTSVNSKARQVRVRSQGASEPTVYIGIHALGVPAGQAERRVSHGGHEERVRTAEQALVPVDLRAVLGSSPVTSSSRFPCTTRNGFPPPTTFSSRHVLHAMAQARRTLAAHRGRRGQLVVCPAYGRVGSGCSRGTVPRQAGRGVRVRHRAAIIIVAIAIAVIIVVIVGGSPGRLGCQRRPLCRVCGPRDARGLRRCRAFRRGG
ncbi:hypothetical protein BC834DRAFT_871414 [Gloeopeniophorella convolvens]|nr:hypothetical protein BC834DRAFT_871414 [Gloeopeniophorella convolvens]